MDQVRQDSEAIASAEKELRDLHKVEVGDILPGYKHSRQQFTLLMQSGVCPTCGAKHLGKDIAEKIADLDESIRGLNAVEDDITKALNNLSQERTAVASRQIALTSDKRQVDVEMPGS